MNLKKYLFQALLSLVLGGPTTAQELSIDSVSTTESRCEQSGTITVYASGPDTSTNYRYQIIAPSCCTRTLQTSNVFPSLLPDTYKVVAINVITGASDTTNATVTGDYTIMSPTASVSGTSCSGSGASITIDLTGGRSPYSYEIREPASEATGIVSTNTFNNLHFGTTYTYRVYDSCGNFQTRTVTPTASDHGEFAVSRVCLKNEGCDSFSLAYKVNVTSPQTHRYPYTIEFYKPDGGVIYDTIYDGSATADLLDTFYFSGVSGDFFGVVLTNGCGAENNDENSIALSSYLDMTATQTPLCDGTNQYRFDRYDNTTSGLCDAPHGESITYTLLDPDGLVLATQVNNSTFSGDYGGANYQVVRTTTCHSDTLTFNWSSTPPAMSIGTPVITQNPCKDSTVNLRLPINNGIGNKMLVMTSGPDSVIFEDGSVHHYSYPDTFTNYKNNQYVTLLGAGVYSFEVIDACGNTANRNINIIPSVTRRSDVNFSKFDGCINSSIINWEVSGNSSASPGTISVEPGGYSYNVTSLPETGSAGSLEAGTYYCTYTFTSGEPNRRYPTGMADLACDVLSDTIVIKPYQNPVFFGPSVTHCSGMLNDFLLIPDLSSGVAPFNYEIIAGPELRSPQASPLFTELPYGTYTFRMSDACGNSFTANKEVGELTTVVFETLGSTCEDSTAMLAVPHSPYVSYSWIRPDGSTFEGDTLVISPVTAADTGTYQIEMRISISDCLDTVNFVQRLDDFCGSIDVLPVTLVSFYGKADDGRSLLAWKTANEANNIGFFVERSSDGRQWQSQGFVPTQAQNGNSNAELSYSFTDDKPLAGRNMYRLKQTDIDGLFNYSKIVILNFGQEDNVLIYPNPAQQAVTVVANAQQIYLYNILGQRVSAPVVTNSDQHSVDISTLAPGNYTLQVINEGNSAAYPLVIAR